jgi:hypothetical protein
VNHYNFDTKRVKCPYCGSSDGFAELLHPDTKSAVGAGVGKCHSCNVFRTQTEAGFVTDTGDLVVSKGPIEAKFFDVSILPSKGLSVERSNLVTFVESLIGSDVVQQVAQQMLVYGDSWGNTSFVYADVEGRGMSVKTILYGENAKRDKTGIKIGSRSLETSQIAGYVPVEGTVRYVRVADGAYQFLYGQQCLKSNPMADVVVIVESEKTAFMATVFARILNVKAIFLAAGGTNGVTVSKLRGLTPTKAIHENFTSLMSKRQVVICYDNDEAGEKGSSLCQQALSTLKIESRTFNMQDVLEEYDISLPPAMRPKADLADVIINAMQNGNMLDEIEVILRGIYNRAKGIVDVQNIIADNELEKIQVSDYAKEPPKPSLTFSEASSDKVSQLAIPGNIVMLLASPGVGKSSVISAIVARHISPKTNAFGLDINAPRGLVVVDTEQSKDQVVQLHKRMARRIGCYAEELPAMFAETNVHWFVSNKKLKVEKQCDNLFAVVAQTDPSFVIVDQVGSLVNNVNSTEEVQSIIRRIAVDAETNLRTWVVVLHTNPTSDKGRGVLGSDIHRWASSVLFIKRPAEPTDPSLLTTSNIDGIMAKVRSGPPVRCFFSWDDSRSDFYPTNYEPVVGFDASIVKAAIDAIFTQDSGMSQPLSMADLRKNLKDAMGYEQGNQMMGYIIKESIVKRTGSGKLWPDYEKLNSM